MRFSDLLGASSVRGVDTTADLFSVFTVVVPVHEQIRDNEYVHAVAQGRTGN